MLKELQENENLNERKQLIEYLDQIGNDKAGFDPVSCLQLDSDFIFMDNMDKTQSDQEVSFKDEEMSKNRLAKLDEFMPDDLNQEDKNKTLQAALKSVQTLTLNATDFNLEQEDFNLEQADFNLEQADFNLEHAEIEDYLNCDSDCESLKSETEMSSTFESTEQENAEKLKLTITIVGSVCLIVIVLILFAFAIKECCFPSFSFC